ncbi:hypothetical protein H7J06_22125 [Mycobacterium hodleri]|uniref:hypothetical protein n=1 Tax=Mycolicibacterium hodleri TaxID=49897 RepID=UPI0021F304FA|nr:hypothetical protein [Mycolicibacterium hodleri]MCV7135676.1 hypothetical protein [Mycolicibacterium hodleri]
MPEENAQEVVENPAQVIADDPADEPKTYDADYVNGLKKEAIDHRHKATTLATRLHTELVRQTGRLADPAELGFDPTHLDDPEALSAAIDELLTRKPHYAARTPHGNVGQGAKDQGAQPGNLISTLKSFV